MKKVFLTACLIVALTAVAAAQRGANALALRADLGIPIGTFGDLYKTGVGGSAMGLFGIGTGSKFTIRSGYMRFEREGSSNNVEQSLNFIPILGGIRQRFSNLYGQVEAGIDLVGTKFRVGNTSTETDHTSRFAWSLGLGTVISRVDIGVRYESFNWKPDNYGFVGIHAGINLPL